jgi:flagellar motor switch protein FliM
MAEMLNQDEVDALLAAIATGKIDPDDLEYNVDSSPRVRIHDFRMPRSCSTETIALLQDMHEKFADLCNRSWLPLADMTGVFLGQLDQPQHVEALRCMPPFCCVAEFDMDPLPGTAWLEIDPQLQYRMVESMCGGRSIEPGPKKRDRMSDTELSIMEGVIVRMLGNLREAWSGAVDLRPRLLDVHDNARHVGPRIGPREPCVLIGFEVKLDEAEGIMYLCLPSTAIRAMERKIAENAEKRTSDMSELRFRAFHERGWGFVTLGDLKRLGPGDFIELERTGRWIVPSERRS